MKRLLAVIALAGWFIASARADELEKGFVTPPASAKPWSYWFWMNQNITREGITADLEAMKQIGVGGMLVMDVSYRIPDGPVEFLSPEWRALFKHAVTEADRLGLQITMNDDAGWMGSGGPWIKPEQAMKKLVWTATSVRENTTSPVQLPQPQAVLDFYRDEAVLAFPTPEGDAEPMAVARPKFSSNVTEVSGDKLTDHNLNTFVSLPFKRGKEAPYVLLEFPKPFRARSLALTHPPRASRDRAERGVVQVSDDGEKFRTIQSFRLDWASVTVSFPETTSRFYRIAFLGRQPRAKAITLAELELTGAPRVQNWESKAGFVFINEHGGGAAALANDAAALQRQHATAAPENFIRRDAVLDLTSKVDKQGQLTWTPPSGNWTVLRIGYTLTGAQNKPSTAAGQGLEPDKFDPQGIEAAFAGLMAKLLKDVGPLGGKALAMTHIDSWEVGSQTWTAAFREEFKKRRGYDLLPWLPVMAGGRVVNSSELSERFLWDVRRTYGDLIAENYFGRMAKLCHEHGIGFQGEASGRQQFMYDPVAFQSKNDLPMGEFWIGGGPRVDCKVASSTAHLNGLPIVGAEAYTSGKGDWQDDPFSLKALGDRAFCLGINRYFFCCGNLQPWLDRKPGMTTGPWGMNFDRTQTWWKPGAAWVSYITRCQYLLQRGKFVGDVCYLPGESVPNYLGWRDELSLPLPEGYDYDGISADIIINRMTVKDGRIVVPSGMSYRVLLLPDSETMTPELLRKIKTLVADGATVVGPKPSKSPSLRDYPQGDTEVRRLADEVWGDCDGKKVTAHEFGKGRVMWGGKFEEIFSAIKLPPDFGCTANAPANLKFIHRQAGDAEIYFISNQKQQPVDAVCTFRVSGKQPELWHPDTGQTEAASAHEIKDGVTSLPVRLDPSGSLFVVFRKAASNQKSEVAKNWLEFKPAQEIAGAWDLAFPPNWGAPAAVNLPQLISWSDHADSGVKYFSGTATYTKEVEIPAALLGAGRSLWLDLGVVKNLAEVSMNGKPLGVLWKPPFRVDITGAAQPGKNRLEIKVTNLWPNRLIGDEQLPADREWTDAGTLKSWPQWLLAGQPSPTGRLTFTTWHHWKKSDALLPSGLLGPVTLQTAVKTVL